jgi:hypothetical protein
MLVVVSAGSSCGGVVFWARDRVALVGAVFLAGAGATVTTAFAARLGGIEVVIGVE